MPYRSEVVRPRPTLLPPLGCGAPRRDAGIPGGHGRGQWVVHSGLSVLQTPLPPPHEPVVDPRTSKGALHAFQKRRQGTRSPSVQASPLRLVPGFQRVAASSTPPHTPPSSPAPTTACTHFLRLPWRLFPAHARIGYTWLRAALGQRGGQGPRGRWVDLPELGRNIGVAPGSAPSCVGNFLQAEQPVVFIVFKNNEFTEF